MFRNPLRALRAAPRPATPPVKSIQFTRELFADSDDRAHATLRAARADVLTVEQELVERHNAIAPQTAQKSGKQRKLARTQTALLASYRELADAMQQRLARTEAYAPTPHAQIDPEERLQRALFELEVDTVTAPASQRDIAMVRIDAEAELAACTRAQRRPRARLPLRTDQTAALRATLREQSAAMEAAIDTALLRLGPIDAQLTALDDRVQAHGATLAAARLATILGGMRFNHDCRRQTLQLMQRATRQHRSRLDKLSLRSLEECALVLARDRQKVTLLTQQTDQSQQAIETVGQAVAQHCGDELERAQRATAAHDMPDLQHATATIAAAQEQARTALAAVDQLAARVGRRQPQPALRRRLPGAHDAAREQCVQRLHTARQRITDLQQTLDIDATYLAPDSIKHTNQGPLYAALQTLDWDSTVIGIPRAIRAQMTNARSAAESFACGRNQPGAAPRAAAGQRLRALKARLPGLRARHTDIDAAIARLERQLDTVETILQPLRNSWQRNRLYEVIKRLRVERTALQRDSAAALERIGRQGDRAQSLKVRARGSELARSVIEIDRCAALCDEMVPHAERLLASAVEAERLARALCALPAVLAHVAPTDADSPAARSAALGSPPSVAATPLAGSPGARTPRLESDSPPHTPARAADQALASPAPVDRQRRRRPPAQFFASPVETRRARARPVERTSQRPAPLRESDYLRVRDVAISARQHADAMREALHRYDPHGRLPEYPLLRDLVERTERTAADAQRVLRRIDPLGAAAARTASMRRFSEPLSGREAVQLAGEAQARMHALQSLFYRVPRSRP